MWILLKKEVWSFVEIDCEMSEKNKKHILENYLAFLLYNCLKILSETQSKYLNGFQFQTYVRIISAVWD